MKTKDMFWRFKEFLQKHDDILLIVGIIMSIIGIYLFSQAFFRIISEIGLKNILEPLWEGNH